MKFIQKLFARSTEPNAATAEEEGRVSGLKLPPRLRERIAAGKWKTPSDERMSAILPGLKGRVDFLETHAAIASESLDALADHMNTSCLFKVYRGSRDEAQPLPWLDAERAVVIAVNRDPGADLAVVLDYRDAEASPCVVFSDWWSEPRRCNWVKAYDSFDAFAECCEASV